MNTETQTRTWELDSNMGINKHGNAQQTGEAKDETQRGEHGNR